MPKQEYDPQRLRKSMELGENSTEEKIKIVLTNWRDAERRGRGTEFLNSLTSERQKEIINEVLSREYELLAKEAREVFKEHFFGIAEVEEAFTLKDGTKLVEFSLSQKSEVIKNLRNKLNEPDIKIFLSKLKQRRQQEQTGNQETQTEDLQDPNKWSFILRTDKMRIKTMNEEGKEEYKEIPLTMLNLQTYLAPDMEEQNQGRLFSHTDWYQNEPFYTQDTPKSMEWKLATNEVFEETLDHNYLDQTQILIDTLIQNFPENQIPPEYKEAIQEFETRRESLQKLLQTNWLQAGRELVNLKITQLLRRSPIEMIYDYLVRFRNMEQRSYTNPVRYDQSNKLLSDGWVVGFGYFGTNGGDVRNYFPDRWGSRIGSSFSR